MKKHLLFLIIALCGVMSAHSETWKSIGKGTWTDGWMLEPQQPIEIEQSVENKYRLRVKSFDNFPNILGKQPIINICDIYKVYFERFILADYTFANVVGEDGWYRTSTGYKSAGYGRIENNKIIIPAEFIKYHDVGADWQISKDKITITLPSTYKVDIPSSGVYFGVTAFNYNYTTKWITLINKENKDAFNEFVNTRTMDDATFLYHSVDHALAQMEMREYPSDLSSATLITFTDGNDDGSLSTVDASWDDAKYQQFISSRIKNSSVKELPLQAYSIGLKGKDIGEYNYELFKSNLSILASAPENAMEVSNMQEVETTLNSIIDGLENSWINHKVSFYFNMRGNGDIVRFTLDKTRDELNNNPENSDVWIEGEFSRSNDGNTLKNIQYKGLTSTSGTQVKAETVRVNGKSKVCVTLENIKMNDGTPFEPTIVEYWHKTTSNPFWQPHTEFNPGTDAKPETERKSAAIMFVMDCSTSLGNDFPELQRVVNSLIDRLVPDGITGIDTPVVEEEFDSDAPVEYYNLQGMRIVNPTHGLYIRRQGKRAEKVIL